MGLVQRDGINRLRHAMRYSRQDLDDLRGARPIPAGWPGSAPSAAPTRARWRAVRPDRDLGRQPGQHPGQRDDPCRQARRRSAAPSSSWSIPTAPARPSRPTCIWRCGPAPTARWPAPSCTCCSRRAMPTADYMRALHRRAGRAGGASGDAHARMGGGDHRPAGRAQIVAFARLYGAHQAQLHLRLGYGFTRSRNGAAQHACRDLPAGGHRRLAARGRRRALCHTGIYPHRPAR